MILDTTTRSLEIVLAGAVATTQLKVVSDWVEMTATATTGGGTTASTNNGTAVSIVAAPAASAQRKINTINVFNSDTASATVTIRYNDNGTIYNLVSISLSAGYTLQFTDVAGWEVISSAGLIQSGLVGATGPAGSTILSGINNQTGTTYTLVITDNNWLVIMNNASAITVTVPPFSSVPFPVGSVVYITGIGAGLITVAQGAGVSINASSSLKTRAQYSVLGIANIAHDSWILYGDQQ